jgi:predicted ATPase
LAATVCQFRREAPATHTRAEALIALSTEQGFPLWEAYGKVLQGWALAAQGQAKEGIAQMRRGHDAWQATGAELDRPYFLVLLAEAYGRVGQANEGLRLLAEASAVGDKGERYWEAELYRLQGAFATWHPRREALAAIQVPVTLLVGRESRAFFGEMARWLAPRLRVPVVTVPGRHGAYVDHAPELAEALRPIFRRWTAR